MRPASPRSRVLVAAAAALLGALVSKTAAAADRVAVLRFTASGGGTTSTQLAAARIATHDAVVTVHDTPPTDAEMAAAEAAVKDGVPDTSEEYRAAGRAAAAQWTLAGRVDAHGATYRLELEACQMATGRVESLAREVDVRAAVPQIAEMLGLLLRPQGVGDAVPPWDQGPAPPVPAASKPVPSPATPPAATPTATPVAPPAPEPQPKPPSDVEPYAASRPFAVGVGGDVSTAFARSKMARGSATAGGVAGTVLYALPAVHGLELLVDVGAGVVGPTSLHVDGGARYEIPIVPAAGLYVGPEVALGAFVPFGGDKEARFLVRGALPVVWAASDLVQIEAFPELAWAAGGTASLGFVGGGARAVIRF